MIETTIREECIRNGVALEKSGSAG